jgi:hypothetical protein
MEPDKIYFAYSQNILSKNIRKILNFNVLQKHKKEHEIVLFVQGPSNNTICTQCFIEFLIHYIM